MMCIKELPTFSIFGTLVYCTRMVMGTVVKLEKIALNKFSRRRED
jgi:hypothetical protein